MERLLLCCHVEEEVAQSLAPQVLPETTKLRLVERDLGGMWV
jgi:hypothetical protein